MMKTLSFVLCGLLAAIMSASTNGRIGAQSPPEPGVGYTNTPVLPNSPWRVHDKYPPRPTIVKPADSIGRAPSDATILFDNNPTRFRNIWVRSLREEVDPWVVMPAASEGNLPGKGKKIVLVSGDDEYRSEESLPMLGKILSEQHGYDCVVLFAINPETQTVDPSYQSNIPGLHHLDDADAMVMCTRFRSLPDWQMAHFEKFFMEGKPFIALRTSTHPFNFPADSKSAYKKWAFNSKEWQGGFGQQIIGETWHSHHGKHASQATRGVIAEESKASPILKGVSDVFGPSDVYGVVHLPETATVLLRGQVVNGMNPTDPALEGPKNNPMMPLAWTKDYQMPNGKPGKLFCTTMGAANDFLSEDLRRLVVNATYWMTGLESKIPERASAKVAATYKPSNFGFKPPKFFTDQLIKPIDLVPK